MELSKIIFWDTDEEKVDYERNARYIISKVVMYGTIDDWKQIKSYYGLQRIKQEMLQERYLDKKALSFLSCILETPKEEFRCYTEQRSIPPHWNY